MTDETMRPLRLAVQFDVAVIPLVQVTERSVDDAPTRARSRAVDVRDPDREIELEDGQRITIAHALAVLHALARS